MIDKNFDQLKDRMINQLERYPSGFPYNRDGVRLGIAALEDEIGELWQEWEHSKRHLGNSITEIRHELLDIASVAMLMLLNTE